MSARQVKPDRIPCVVIGCGRTASKEWAGNDTEIICGKHWRIVPPYLRRRYSLIRRHWHKALATDNHPLYVRAHRLEAWCWRRIVAAATERAMGITA